MTRFENRYTEKIATLISLEQFSGKHLDDILNYVIRVFSSANNLKYIKPHIMTIHKKFSVTQEEFLDRIQEMNRYLQLLQKYFPSIDSLTNNEMKDTFVHAQPQLFNRYFISSYLDIDSCDIEDLLSYFQDLQGLDNDYHQYNNHSSTAHSP